MKYGRGSGSWLCLSWYPGRGGEERDGAKRPYNLLDSIQRVLHNPLENFCELNPWCTITLFGDEGWKALLA